jgi:hypothetical protein
MGDKQDDTPRYTKAQVQEILAESEKQTLATMSPNFNELVPPSIAKHLESLSLQATANASANSGTSKPLIRLQRIYNF